MRTTTLKKLKRNQLEKFLKINFPEIGFNKKTSVKNLRLKFNMLGGEFATITFNSKFQIENP